LPASTNVSSGQARREVVECVAGDERDPPDPRGAVGGEDLDEPAASVVADERDVVELEAFKELGDEPGDARQGEVGVGAHRLSMRAEWQRWRDAAVVVRELRDDVVPEGGIH